MRQLTLGRDMAALRYPPRGQRTIMYRRTKAELFAENVHPEGTTMRLTLYKVGWPLLLSLLGVHCLEFVLRLRKCVFGRPPPARRPRDTRRPFIGSMCSVSS